MRVHRRAIVLAVAAVVLVAAVAADGVAMPNEPTRLVDALGLRDADPGLDRRRSEAVAVLTAACMADHGFVYLPVVEAPPAIPDADLGPVAWAERWGFGVSTSIDAAPPPPQPDPNLEAVGRMPPGERDRYLVALHGPAAGGGGCHGKAVDAVLGLRDRALAPLARELDALEAAIDGDPGTVALLGAWRDCVRPAGFAAADRSTLGSRLIDAFAARVAVAGDRTALAAIQAEERAVATVVAHCEVAYAAGRDAVAAVHEAPFVRAHLVWLRSIGAGIRAAEAALPTLPPTSSHPTRRH